MTTTDKIVDLIRAARDLLLIALGFTIMVTTPASLEDFGLSGTGAHIWAATLLLGALGALYAAMTNRLLLEVWSCCLVIGGLLMWIIALVWRDDANVTSWSVALVVACAVCGELVRIADTVGDRRATR